MSTWYELMYPSQWKIVNSWLFDKLSTVERWKKSRKSFQKVWKHNVRISIVKRLVMSLKKRSMKLANQMAIDQRTAAFVFWGVWPPCFGHVQITHKGNVSFSFNIFFVQIYSCSYIENHNVRGMQLKVDSSLKGILWSGWAVGGEELVQVSRHHYDWSGYELRSTEIDWSLSDRNTRQVKLKITWPIDFYCYSLNNSYSL